MHRSPINDMTIKAMVIVAAATLYPRSIDAQEIIRNGALSPQVNRLEDSSFDIDISIGVEADDDRYMFGAIADVCIVKDGCIFVLDRGFKRVQVYGPDGSYLNTIGRAGPGPGEFQYPAAIALDDTDLLYVLDRYDIIIYNRKGEYLSQFRPEIKGAGMPRSIAIDFSENIIITRYDVFDETVIHAYDKHHRKIIDFGDPYSKGLEDDAGVQSMVAGGQVSVDSKGRIVYSQALPYEIRRYDQNFALELLILRDNDFMSPPIKEDVGGGMRVLPTSFSRKVLSLPDGRIANVVKIRSEENPAIGTLIDIFSDEGLLLTSEQLEGDVHIAAVDAIGRFYIIDSRESVKLLRASLNEQQYEEVWR